MKASSSTETTFVMLLLLRRSGMDIYLLN
jgi:hypothetical protein